MLSFQKFWRKLNKLDFSRGFRYGGSRLCWSLLFLKMPDNKKLSGNEFKSSGFMLAVNLAILSDN